MVIDARKHVRMLLSLILCWCSGALCHAGEIEAALDRETVPAGQAALLTLTISGNPSGRPQLPEVKDFIFQSQGQSQQFRSVNGVTSRSITYQYAVGSQVPGDYEIPAISATVDGQQLSTDPLHLKVLAGNAALPPSTAGANQPDSDEPTTDEDLKFGFLKVELLTGERKHVYVGEIAPVKIEAWIPAAGQAQLRSGIQPEGKAFTLHNVSERPSQSRQIRDGKQYIVVTWYGGISATKAGEYPVSLSLEATVAVRDTAALQRPRRPMGGAFDDPFFDSIFDRFNTPMIQKDITLASRNEGIEVRLLPEEGKPDGFSGAVGDFALKGWNIPGNWKTGEPQSVEVRVGGKGNFALLSEPLLKPSEGWKVYPGKSEFTPGDVASFSGTKDFRFSAVPAKHGTQELSLELSYFDPDAGEYRTVSSPSREVDVTGEDIVFEEAKPVVAIPPTADDQDSLIGQHAELSGVRDTLVPLVSRPLFMGLLGGSGLLCCAGLGMMLARSMREDPERIANARLETETREALGRVKQAESTGDVAGFFEAGRHALQVRLGASWDRPAVAIALADVQSRLDEDSPVVRFFQEADHQSYGLVSDSGAIPKWRSLLDEALLSLKPNPRSK